MILHDAGHAVKHGWIWLLVVWLAGCIAAPPSIQAVEGTALMAQPHSTSTPVWMAKKTRVPSIPFPTWTFTATEPQAPTATQTPTVTPTPTAGFLVCSPVATLKLDEIWHYISVYYLPPPMGDDARHQGIDITYYSLAGERKTIMGAEVQSVLRGRVAVAVADSYPYGNLIIIETPQFDLTPNVVERLNIPENRSLYILYAHLQMAPLVKLGETVSACQLLDYVGKSGNTDAPHLHLEMRLGPVGISFEGLSAFTESVTPLEKENYIRWRIGGEFVHFDPMLLLDPQHPSPTVTPHPTQKSP